MKIRRIIQGGVVALGAAALSLGMALPASAAGLDKALVPGDEANTYVVQEQVVRDAGGQDITVKVLWTETYQTEAGNYRVGVKVLSINANGVDLDEDGPGDGGLDATVKTYQGYATAPTKLIQSRTFDGVDDPFSFNNSNPLNRPGKSKVVITAGVNDDGHGNSLPATFVQPVIGDEDPGADGPGAVDV